MTSNLTTSDTNQRHRVWGFRGFTALVLALIYSSAAMASDTRPINGVIDLPLPERAALNPNALKQQVKKEQQQLAKLNTEALKQKAEAGERLAQVALATDYAKEAQMLAFAPAAASAAQSDAIRWYSIAAKRGYPGAPALDRVGISFFPVRVIRNK